MTKYSNYKKTGKLCFVGVRENPGGRRQAIITSPGTWFKF